MNENREYVDRNGCGNAFPLTWYVQQCDNHSAQWKTDAERVRGRVFLFVEYLRDDQQIVEEEHLTLMDTGSFLLVNVWYFVQSTIAHQSSMRQRQIRFFAHNRCLYFHHLRHVIGAGLEFVGFDTFVDAHQHVTIDIVAIVNATQILNKIFDTHSTLRFQVRRVQIGVQHNDCECHNENLNSPNEKLKYAKN